jgi:hypothetical protein
MNKIVPLFIDSHIQPALANTLAFHITELITAVKRFMIQTPGLLNICILQNMIDFMSLQPMPIVF